MGAIRKRGKILWIRYSRGGKRFEESTGSAKEADAKRLLKLREGDIERGAPVTPRMSRLTVNEAITALLTEYEGQRPAHA
jgi:hypothetical protein